MNTSMTVTMMKYSARKTEYSITPPPIVTDTENTKAGATSVQIAQLKNNVQAMQRMKRLLLDTCGVIM